MSGNVVEWRNADVVQRLGRGADWLNPFLASPAAPLETLAWLESLEPSLMPRTSAMQGVAGGLSLLTARAVVNLAERGLPGPRPDGSLPRSRWVARAASGALGVALMAVPERRDESLWWSGARTSGRLLRVAAIGGMLHDAGIEARVRVPRAIPVRAVAMTTMSGAGVTLWAGRRLAQRIKAVEPWPIEQRLALLPAAAASAVTASVGMGLFRAYLYTRTRWIDYLGGTWPKVVLARVLNGGIWTGAAMAGYTAGVARIGRANARMEPAYAQPPTSKLVSGGPGSLSPFADLGQQGRRFVVDVVPTQLIQDVLGEPARSDPIRTFVGFDSEPLYQTGRAELALDELERTGAFDRSWLLLVSPTGTGWVDQTIVESVEILTRGDVATAAIQYGRYPSFLSIQKVALGRGQFRILLLGIRQRLRERPRERRPKVLVFGESLGAWSSSDVVMDQGIAGFDHYGIDRALWVGLPGLAKWSRNGMAAGSSESVPPGSVRVVDHPEQLDVLSADERDRLRAVILSHDNDPIAQLVPDIMIRPPRWLRSEPRGRGVSPHMHWRPFVTFWQTAVDAANAMVTVPGEFKSYGHDYRADLARVARHAFALPTVTADQLERLEQTLRRLEVERSARIQATPGEAAPPPPAQAVHEEDVHVVGGVPLKGRRTGVSRWRRRVVR